MFKFTKKGILNTALTVTLAATIAQCAWADLDLTKLAITGTDGISVVGNDSGENRYLDDGEEYFIDANSPEAVSVPSTTRLTGNIQLVGNEEKISISLRDADVKQVLRMFADKAKMNIIFHKSVDRTQPITLDIKDISANTALEYILDAAELTYIRDGKNLIIATKSAAKDLTMAKQNFTIIPVKYANAQAIANFLNKNMFSGKYQGVSQSAVIAVNAARNELMVFGTEDDEKLINKFLVKLDTKPMMNVFPVNHITPAEMASTICDTVLSDKSNGGNSHVSLGGHSRGGSDEIQLGGGYTACVIGEGSGNMRGNATDMEPYNSNPLTVAYYPDLGTVAVYGGSREQVKMIEAFIKLHDKKAPMAYIEVSFIDLNEQGIKTFDNAWRMWTPFATFNFDKGGLSTGSDLGMLFIGSKNDIIKVYDSSKDAYTGGDPKSVIAKNKFWNINHWGPIVATINYLVNNGKGRVLANPKVMVTNGKKTTINLTDQYLASVSLETSGDQLQVVSGRTYNIGDTGITLDITPFISPDGYVVMNLNPNYSIVKGSPDNHSDVTLTSSRNVQLENVRVKDGETLVLAGYIRESESQGITKIPVLGDLPVVGPLFRSTTNTKNKDELVIMITPHIVYSEDQINSLKAKENADANL